MNAGLTDYSAAFKECLEKVDVVLMCKLWEHVAPNMPQPKNDEETLTTIHIARTECNSISPKLRMYSHCWLRERGFPSQLPDYMRQAAERMYPKIVSAVGISVNFRSPLLRPAEAIVRQAMSNAVLDIHAHDPDLRDSALVKRRMNEAKINILNKLFGLKK